MNINNQHYRTIWPNWQKQSVEIIDQTKLPFRFDIVQINTLDAMITAISTMQVRGAPLIGVAAAYGVALALLKDQSDKQLATAAEQLIQSRPTAVNLSWAVNTMVSALQSMPQHHRVDAAWGLAAKIADDDVKQNQAIGHYGLDVIKQRYQNKQLHILTHCNAGWLATVDFGTALSPIYAAHDAGLDLHVWVGETRPRNQGAHLTAWELSQHGIPHTVIADNAAGHLMQQGLVDMVIVGADRVTANGDVCNKIGTYLRAVAAHDNEIPFYAAVPTPTIDFELSSGDQINIEERHGDEVAYIHGQSAEGDWEKLRVIPEESKTHNPAFDVTPARLVTAIITEKGVFDPAQLQTSLDVASIPD